MQFTGVALDAIRTEAANAIRQKANAELAGAINVAERQYNGMINDFQDRSDYENFVGDFRKRQQGIRSITAPSFKTREGRDRFAQWLGAREVERQDETADIIRAKSRTEDEANYLQSLDAAVESQRPELLAQIGDAMRSDGRFDLVKVNDLLTAREHTLYTNLLLRSAGKEVGTTDFDGQESLVANTEFVPDAPASARQSASESIQDARKDWNSRQEELLNDARAALGLELATSMLRRTQGVDGGLTRQVLALTIEAARDVRFAGESVIDEAMVNRYIEDLNAYDRGIKEIPSDPNGLFFWRTEIDKLARGIQGVTGTQLRNQVTAAQAFKPGDPLYLSSQDAISLLDKIRAADEGRARPGAISARALTAAFYQPRLNGAASHRNTAKGAADYRELIASRKRVLDAIDEADSEGLSDSELPVLAGTQLELEAKGLLVKQLEAPPQPPPDVEPKEVEVRIPPALKNAEDRTFVEQAWVHIDDEARMTANSLLRSVTGFLSGGLRSLLSVGGLVSVGPQAPQLPSAEEAAEGRLERRQEGSEERSQRRAARQQQRENERFRRDTERHFKDINEVLGGRPIALFEGEFVSLALTQTGKLIPVRGPITFEQAENVRRFSQAVELSAFMQTQLGIQIVESPMDFEGRTLQVFYNTKTGIATSRDTGEQFVFTGPNRAPVKITP